MRKHFQHFLVQISSLISLMNTLTEVNENHKLSVLLKLRPLCFKGPYIDSGNRYDNIYNMLLITSYKNRSEKVREMPFLCCQRTPFSRTPLLKSCSVQENPVPSPSLKGKKILYKSCYWKQQRWSHFYMIEKGFWDGQILKSLSLFLSSGSVSQSHN